MNAVSDERLMQRNEVRVDRADLLSALNDSSLDSISFLNEVIDRYPSAISFAPGAPFSGFFEEIDIARHVAAYVEYLRKKKHLSAEQIRRRLYQYGASRGQINELLADALRMDEGIDVPAETIVVTVGCQEAMLLALRALCSKSADVVAIVNPCFAGIAGAARILGVETVAIEEGENGIALDDLKQACAQARKEDKRIRLLYVAPDYSNPSGTLIDLNTRRRLLEIAHEEDFLILEDNTYGFTADQDDVVPTLKVLDRNKRVIYLGTCAKTCLPGVRVGFMVADQTVVNVAGNASTLADELALIKSMVTVNTSPICQAIVGGMMLEKNGSLAAVGREKGTFYRRNLAYLLDALERHIPAALRQSGAVRWNRPQGGFFVRMQLPVPADEALLDFSASTYGVLWTPMKYFFLNGGGQREIRLSCSYLTTQEIEQGVSRLAAFLVDPRVAASHP